MYDASSHALPDPDRHAAFYDGVALRRGIAWVIDTVFVTLLVMLVALVTALTALFILPLVWLAVGFLYRWVTISGPFGDLGHARHVDRVSGSLWPAL